MARPVLDAIAQTLDEGSAVCTGGTITGQSKGRLVGLAFLVDDSGDSPKIITHASAEIPESPVFLEARKRTRHENEQAREGLALYVLLGDETFDPAFIIEAAPSQLASLILDKAMREDLLRLRPISLLVERKQVRLRFDYPIADAKFAIEAVQLARGIAERVPQALALVFPPEQAYRSKAHDRSLAVREWDKEFQSLQQSQAKRRRVALIRRFAAPAAWGFAIVVFFVLSWRC